MTIKLHEMMKNYKNLIKEAQNIKKLRIEHDDIYSCEILN